MRLCSKCKKEKDLSLFVKNKTCQNGRSFVCRECQNITVTNWKRKNKIRLAIHRRELYHNSFGKASKLRIEERKILREQNFPFISRARIMRMGMISRSKNGVPFDSDFFTTKYLTDLLINQINCICCNIELDVNFKHDSKLHNNSPSIDKFIPELGYVKGNVVLLCWRCNNLKRDATSLELRRIADWMDTWGNDEKLNLQPLEFYQ